MLVSSLCRTQMAIRNQPKSDKHPYASPTTPGLFVAFRDYVIELVCLNHNPKLGPRFWSDKGYWAKKYGREIRGVSNIGKQLDIEDTLTQTAVVETIKERRIKSLSATKTVAMVVRVTKQKMQQITETRQNLAQKAPIKPVDSKKNSTFVDTGTRNRLSKIRNAENG